MRIKYGLVLIALLTTAILAACENAPGEITGKVTYADGRDAAVMVKIFDASNKVVHTVSTSTGGVYYSGRRIPPGIYTVRVFRGDEQLGEDHEVTVDPDASVVCNIVI
jgi:hypothetical protein